MVTALQPGKSRITGAVVGPTFESLWNFDSQFLGAPHNGRSWIRGEDICPKLGVRITFAHVLNEVDGFLPLPFTFSRESKDNIEGGADSGVDTLFSRQVHGFELLKVLVHQLQNFARRGFRSVANLLQS